MNFNYQKARNIMVENQLRPNKIKDIHILELFNTIPKEEFLPEQITLPPYSDLDIPLLKNRGYLKNLHIAQLIHNAEIENTHKVLHIGALTGYVTSILANLSAEVYAIETEPNMLVELKNNIRKTDTNNIKIVDGSFKEGFPNGAPFDRIIIDTPIKEVSKELFKQLSPDLGKIIMVKKVSDDLGKAEKITINKNNISNEFLFDVFSKYELYSEVEEFIF